LQHSAFCDGSLFPYNDIPEYEMLKRGMTEEEREAFGYGAVLQMTEELGKD